MRGALPHVFPTHTDAGLTQYACRRMGGSKCNDLHSYQPCNAGPKNCSGFVSEYECFYAECNPTGYYYCYPCEGDLTMTLDRWDDSLHGH